MIGGLVAMSWTKPPPLLVDLLCEFILGLFQEPMEGVPRGTVFLFEQGRRHVDPNDGGNAPILTERSTPFSDIIAMRASATFRMILPTFTKSPSNQFNILLKGRGL